MPKNKQAKAPGMGRARCLYSKYVARARTAKIEFSLNFEEFLRMTSSDCTYCGMEPKQFATHGRYNGTYYHNGLDRVDSKLGYHTYNCVPCCKVCNYMKQSLTVEQFKTHIIRVYKKQQNLYPGSGTKLFTISGNSF